MRQFPIEAVLDEASRLRVRGVPFERTIAAIAAVLRKHTGADRVALHCAFVPHGAHAPPLDEPTYAGDTALPEGGALVPLQQTLVLGARADGGDLRELTSEVVTRDAPEKGRVRLQDPAHEAALLVRVRSERFVAWAALSFGAGAPPASELAAWPRPIATALRALLEPWDPRKYQSNGTRIDAFHNRLLALEPKSLEADTYNVCELWRAYGDADWAWLWMFNTYTNTYELTSAASRDPVAHKRILQQAERSVPSGEDPNANNVGDYCSRLGCTEHIEDVGDWKRERDGRTYELKLARFLRQVGCESVCCVPLLERPPAGGDAKANMITLHYTKRERARPQSQELLLTMGRATARFLATSQGAWSQRITEKLFAMADGFLTGRRDLVDARFHYVKDLIALIGESLHVEGVSIFIKSRFDRSIYCLGSTGIQDANGRAIPFQEYTTVQYQPGEGLTGQCFQENRPKLVGQAGREDAHRSIYSEIRKYATPKGGIDPVLLYPIPASAKQPEGEAIGVIRCVGHRCELFGDQLCHFNQAEVAMLAFIARQASPILQTLLAQYAREETVAVIKHDLSTPLTMIRDATDKLRRDVESGRPIAEVDVENVAASCQLALNLVPQLEPSHDAEPKPDLQRTLLEGDIVARLKSTMSHLAWRKNRMRISFGEGFRAIPPLWIDAGLIERALQNIVVNAIKYGAKDSTIRIDAAPPEADARHYVIHVTNEGAGIDDADVGRIFVPYYRSPLARQTVGAGVGLGLAIARQALKAHGGRLVLTSPRNPTIFTLLIPKTAAQGDRGGIHGYESDSHTLRR